MRILLVASRKGLGVSTIYDKAHCELVIFEYFLSSPTVEIKEAGFFHCYQIRNNCV